MTGKIKGITIEFGGDTTKLSSALSKADKEIRNTQKQLSAVERALKFDPGNTDLLTDKQRLLGERLESTKSKLEALQAAQDQLDADGVDKNSEEYKKLQTEIDLTKSKVEGLQEQYDNFGSVGAQKIAAMGEDVKGFGSKVSAVGDSMTKKVTVPVTAAAAASAAAWSEVDEAMDTIVVKTGASGEALEDMQERAKNLATSIPTSFQTASDAVGEVNTRFGLTGDALENLSEKFIKFAELNEQDVSTSVDSVQASMAAFNIDTSQAGDYLDLLNKAGQDTGIDVLVLADSLTKNSVALQEMGFNASDSAMFLANLNKQGLDETTVLSGLKTALKNATNDGKSTNEALQEMQDQMAGAKDKTEAMQIATDLFGSKAGPALGAALYEGQMSLEDLGTSMTDFQGNVEDTFDNTLDPVDDMTVALNNLKEVGSELFATLQEIAAPVLSELVDYLKQFNEWFQQLSPQQQEMAIKIALVAAALGPVLSLVGGLITSIGTIMTTAPALVAGISGIAGTIGTGAAAAGAAIGAMAGPIAIAIAAVVALVAAGVAIYENWDTIKEKAGELKDWIGNKFTEIKDGVTEKWNNVKEKTSETWENIKSGVTEKITNIKEDIAQKWDDIKTKTTETFENIRTGITDKITEAKENALSKIDDIKQGFRDKFDDAKEIVSSAIETIKGFFNFSWSLPHISLPHFSISGSFSLDPPSIPHIGVSWYSKAMGNGMILDNPTIFGMMNGKLLGGGEAGSETVVGTNSLMNMIQNAVNKVAGGQTINYGGVTVQIYANNADADEIYEIFQERMNNDYANERAAMA